MLIISWVLSQMTCNSNFYFTKKVNIISIVLIKDLKIRNMILVSRSKKKIIGLDGYGIKITKQEIIKWRKKIEFVL